MRSAGIIVYIVGLVIAESLRLPARLARGRSNGGGHRSGNPGGASETLVLAAIIAGIWLLPLAYVSTSWLARFDYFVPAWSVWAAAIFFAAGLGLRWQAQTSLGNQWSHTLEVGRDHTLVTNGIYARTRHPIYVSLLLWSAAQPFLLQNLVAGFGGAVAVALVWLVRVPREEAMMLAAFGDEYRRYTATVGRLAPRRQRNSCGTQT